MGKTMRKRTRHATHKSKQSKRVRFVSRKRGGTNPQEPTTAEKREERLKKMKVMRLKEEKKRIEEGVAAATEIDAALLQHIENQPEGHLSNQLGELQAYYGNKAPRSYDKYSPISMKKVENPYNRLKRNSANKVVVLDKVVVPKKRTGHLKRFKKWLKKKITRKNKGNLYVVPMETGKLQHNPLYNSLSSHKTPGSHRTPGSDTITNTNAYYTRLSRKGTYDTPHRIEEPAYADL